MKFKPQCDQCKGLCCVAYAFDATQVPTPKPANEPCVHLLDDHLCAIHAERIGRGYPGCIDYDCFGAGQYVVQQLFGGRDWRQEPEIGPSMFAALRQLKPLREMLQLVELAGECELPEEQRALLKAVRDDLEPQGGWELDALLAADTKALVQAAKEQLQSLRPYIYGA